MTLDIPADAALATILDAAPVALLRLDAGGTIRSSSGSIVRNTSLVGRHLADLAEDRAAAEALVRRAAGGETCSARIRIAEESAFYMVDPVSGAVQTPEARPTQRWWDVTLQPHAGGALVVVTDVTERVAAEVARDELLTGVRCILWHATVRAEDGTVRWDFQLANEDAAQAILPLRLEPGQTWGEAWVRSRHPEDSTRMNQIAAAALQQGRDGYHQTFRCTAADGSTRWLREDVRITTVSPGHWRLTGVCTDITAEEQASERLRSFESLVERTTEAVLVFDTAGRVSYANPAAAALLGHESPSAIHGTLAPMLFRPEEREALTREIIPALDRGWQGRITMVDAHGAHIPVEFNIVRLHSAEGMDRGSAAVVRDITAQLRAEEERLAMQQRLIDAQRAALREVSTPLVPIASEVIAMPLVGAIDDERAQQVMETLLDGIVAFQAATAILDITGVRVVDTQVASALLRVAQAAQLLGTQVVLTGISAEVAQSLVQLGAELRGITIHRTLQSAIAEVLH